MVVARWLGTAALEITDGGNTYLIDPYLTRSSKLQLLRGPVAPRTEHTDAYLARTPSPVAAVVVGHTHFDHAVDIPDIAARCDVPVVGSESLDTLLTLSGQPSRVTVCRGGERVELPGGAAVTMIPSIHGLVLFGRVPYPGDIDPSARLPMKASEYRHGQVFVPKLEVGGLKFMHFGSANLLDEELEGQTADVLFLCVPGWKRTPDYHQRVLSRVQPEVVVPFHFDDFTLPLDLGQRAARYLPFQGMQDFVAAVREHAPQAEVLMPTPFQELNF